MSKRVQNELYTSIEQGDFERVCNLLTKTNLEETNQAGYTPLAIATRAGHFNIVERLIKEGANINAVNDAGQSVLFIACWHNHKDIVELLINQGVNVDQPDQRGWTPLIISVYHDYTEIVETLLQAGANVDHQDSFGKKAIDRAKNVVIISLLRKYSEIDKKVPLSLPGTPYSISMLQDLLRPKSRESLPNREYENSQRSLNYSQKLENISSREERQPTPLKTKATRFEIPENPIDIIENSERKILDLDYKINEELNQAIDVLQQEIEAVVNRSSRDLFRNLTEYVFKTVENLLSSKNYKISNSKIQADFSENFLFKNQLVNISTYRSQYSEEPWYSDNNQDKRIGGIKEDLYQNVNRYIGELDNKVNELSGDAEVKNRIFAVKNAINSELNQYMEYLSGRVKNILEEIASERIKEICEDNKATFLAYGSKGNKSERSSVEDYEIAESLKIPKSRWNKEKSGSQGGSLGFSEGFISNLSEDFMKYKNPQVSSSFQNDELSQSYSKEALREITPVDWSKYSNGYSRHTPPLTNIASALQGFLKFEEKFGK